MRDLRNRWLFHDLVAPERLCGSVAGCEAVYNARKHFFGAVRREATLQLTADAHKFGETVGIPPFTTFCRGTVALAIALTEQRARGSSSSRYNVRCAAAGTDLECRMWAPWCWRGRWWLNLTSPVFAHCINKNRAFEVECSASVPLVCDWSFLSWFLFVCDGCVNTECVERHVQLLQKRHISTFKFVGFECEKCGAQIVFGVFPLIFSLLVFCA